jgi:HK97 family phage major capsid protein
MRKGEGDSQDQAVAACMNMWEKKSVTLAASPAGGDAFTTTEDVKAGARHNASDREMVQTMHDYSAALGADCPPGKGEAKSIRPDPEQTYIGYGEAIKVIGNVEGGVKIGGTLVRFSTAEQPDLTDSRDYFTKETIFGLKPGERKSIPIYFNHTMPLPLDPEYKRMLIVDDEIGDGEIWLDDAGVMVEAILYNRAEYEKAIAGQIKRLGWSSGALGHTMQREAGAGDTHWIKRWIIGEGSVTPIPAEYRNSVIPLKSLSDRTSPIGTAEALTGEPGAGEAALTEQIHQGVKTMTEEIDIAAVVKSAAEEAVKAFAASLPAPKDPVLSVTKDEGDRPFTSIAEQVQAVMRYTKTLGRVVDPRLARLIAADEESVKATGASEGVGSEGGFLLEPTLTGPIIMPIHEEGPFSSMARTLPVSDNSNYGWLNGIDETSRATGSRWGGIRGYRLAEGGTITASKPAFRRIQWELKKYAVLVYDTNELVKDAAQFTAVVEQGSREELAFMLNDDILNGLGLAGPLGIMNSGALITVTRTTGSKVLGDDISAMWQRLSIRGKSKAAWFYNTEVTPQLDALFAVGSTAVLFPYAGYTPNGVRTLYGRPVIETEFNAALNTTGDILLADMSQYLLWEKSGVDAATSIHVAFLTDESVTRFIYRCDGKSALASALTNYKGTGTTSPFVVLGSAT